MPISNKLILTDFARMIRSQRHAISNPPIPMPTDRQIGHENQIDLFVDELVTIFQNDNPKFDAEKFIKACEIDTESK